MSSVLDFFGTNADQAGAAAAVMSAVVGAIASLIAIISVLLATKSIRIQEKHNRLSVRPIPHILIRRKKGAVAVDLHNFGFGPLIIIRMEIQSHKDDRQSYSFEGDDSVSLANFVSTPPDSLVVSERAAIWPQRVISPQQCVSLISVEAQQNDQLGMDHVANCLVNLDKIKLVLYFTDIYNGKFASYNRRLKLILHKADSF